MNSAMNTRTIMDCDPMLIMCLVIIVLQSVTITLLGVKLITTRKRLNWLTWSYPPAPDKELKRLRKMAGIS